MRSLRTVYPDVDGVGYQDDRCDRPRRCRRTSLQPWCRIHGRSPVSAGVAELRDDVGFDVTTRSPVARQALQSQGRQRIRSGVRRASHLDRRFLDGPADPRHHDRLLRQNQRPGSDLDAVAGAVRRLFALWQREVLGSEDDPRSVIAKQIALLGGSVGRRSGTVESACRSGRVRRVFSGQGAEPRSSSISVRTLHDELSDSIAVVSSNSTSMFMVVHSALAVVLLARLVGNDGHHDRYTDGGTR